MCGPKAGSGQLSTAADQGFTKAVFLFCFENFAGQSWDLRIRQQMEHLHENVSLPTNFTNSSANSSDSQGAGDRGDDDYYYDGSFDWHNESVVPTIAYLTLFNTVALLGIFGNVMILMLLRRRSLSSLSYSVYLRFLASSDLLVILYRILEINLDRFHNIYQRMLTWHLRFCQTYLFLDNWTNYLSVWLVVVITCDRYIAVALPLKWKILSTKKRAFCTCLIFCASTLLVSLPVYATIDVVPDDFEEDKYYCSNTKSTRILWDILNFTFSSVLPCAIIFILNMLTVFKIKVSLRKRDELTKSSHIRGGLRTTRSKDRLSTQVSVTSLVKGQGRATISDSIKETSTEEEAGETSPGYSSVSKEAVMTVDKHDAHKPRAEDSKLPGHDDEISADLGDGGDRTDLRRKHSQETDQYAREQGNFRVQERNKDKKKDSQAVTITKSETSGVTPKRGKDKIHSNRSKKGVRVDIVTISLTYISVSAFLTLAPYGILHGLFMIFLDQYDAILAINPFAPVPHDLQNLIRAWDIVELIYLLNFCQNFYILLLTNPLVGQEMRKLFNRAKN